MGKTWAFKKTIGVVLALVVLVGSGVVVGLTVVRIQNERATVGRPKALSRIGHVMGCKYTSDTAWNDRCGSNPASGQGVKLYSYANYQIGFQTINKFFWDNLGEGQQHTVTVDSLSGYDVRGAYCLNSYSCLASDGNSYCRGGPGDSCGTGLPRATVNSGASVTFTIPQDGVGQVNSGEPFVEVDWVFSKSGVSDGAFYTAISPKGGETVSSLTPTFTWTGGVPSNNNYQNICIGTWVDAGHCDSLGCRSTGGGNSYTPSDQLSPNTTYGWLIYSAYSPGTGNIKNMAGGCQQFKTGAANTCASGQILCGTTCVNPNTDSSNCGACGVACGTGKTCVSGVCTASATHFECVNKACAVVAGAGSNKNSCTAASGSCCASSSDCASTQTCDTTQTPNTCVTTTVTHLECVNSACVTVSGAGSNTDGCTSVGETCIGQSLKKVGGCKALEGTVCSTLSNAIFTLSNSPVYLDGVAATQLAASGEPNSFLFNPTSGQHSLSVTPPTGYTVSSYTICDANANCQFDIPGSGPVTVTTPTTSGLASVYWHFTRMSGGCTSNSQCQSGQVCTNGQCVTDTTNQVNACWGNGGTNGKCLDCNGDGVINILDFSCFAKIWQQKI